MVTNSRLLVTGDASLNSRLFVSSDASFNGYVTVKNSTTVTGDLVTNSRLFVTGDSSLNSRLFVGSDASFIGYISVNKSATVVGDLVTTSRLFVTGDSSFNSRLFVGSDASFIGYISVNKSATVVGDVVTNSRLFLVGDASLNSRLFVGSDASMTGNLTLGNSISVAGDASINSRMFVSNLLTANTGLLVTGDSSFNGRVYVGADSSFNGNTNIKTLIVGASTDTNKFTINSSKVNVYDGVSRFYDVSTSKLVFIKDLSENVQTRLTDLINRTLAIDTNATDSNTQMQFDTVNNQIKVYTDIIPATNTVNLGSAANPFNSLFVNTQTIHFTDTNTSAAVSFNSETGGLDIAANGVSHSHVLSHEGKVGIGYGLLSRNATASLDVSGTTNLRNGARITGDLSLNNRLFVQGDASLNGNLYVANNLGVGIKTPLASLHVNGGMITNSDGFPRKLYSCNMGMVYLSSANPALTFTFNNASSYYGNVKAMLVDQSYNNNISTAVFDVLGGAGDGSVATNNILVSEYTRKGPYTTTNYTWSTNYTTTTTTVSLYTLNTLPRNYSINVFVELFSGPNTGTAALTSVTSYTANSSVETVTFNY